MIKNSSKPSDGYSESPSTRPMTLRQQLEADLPDDVLYGLWELVRRNKPYITDVKQFEEISHYFKSVIDRMGQEIAREARSDWTLELPDLPWFQIKAFNEERAEWWSPIYDTTNLPVELTQKPPQPPQGGLEEVSDGPS